MIQNVQKSFLRNPAAMAISRYAERSQRLLTVLRVFRSSRARWMKHHDRNEIPYQECRKCE